MISVTILAKNSGRTIQKVLQALGRFDEVIVADTGSTDNTKEIVSSFPHVKLVDLPFNGFGPTHNALSAIAKNDWIFSVDSDEVAPDNLVDEILSLQLQQEYVYSVARKNYYRDRWIWSCGWWPDRVVRLYNRKKTAFSDRAVHEAVITDDLSVVSLKNPLTHTPFLSVSDFLQKMDRYTTLAAVGKTAKPWSPFFHGMAAFFKSYIIKRGLFQGSVGFEISLYNALSSYYKYLKRIK